MRSFVRESDSHDPQWDRGSGGSAGLSCVWRALRRGGSAQREEEALAPHLLAFEVWTPLSRHFLLLQKRTKPEEMDVRSGKPRFRF